MGIWEDSHVRCFVVCRCASGSGSRLDVTVTGTANRVGIDSQSMSPMRNSAQGRNEAAVTRIRAAIATLRPDDPAAMINMGTAYARMGREADARDCFIRAIASRERYDLELANGQWMDSRRAARVARRAAATADRLWHWHRARSHRPRSRTTLRQAYEIVKVMPAGFRAARRPSHSCHLTCASRSEGVRDESLFGSQIAGHGLLRSGCWPCRRPQWPMSWKSAEAAPIWVAGGPGTSRASRCTGSDRAIGRRRTVRASPPALTHVARHCRARAVAGAGQRAGRQVRYQPGAARSPGLAGKPLEQRARSRQARADLRS